ncbi:MAG: glycosyltransferase family 4 protein [Pseudomonadota bacterium]
MAISTEGRTEPPLLAEGARFVLLVPHGAGNPKTGGGQRTRLFFDALKRLGPVEVILFGNPVPEGQGSFFPGAAAFHVWNSSRFAPPGGHAAKKLRYNIARFSSVERAYRADPDLAGRVRAVLDAGPVVVVSRYLMPFAASGFSPDDAACEGLLIDIDDRDDKKFAVAFERLLGSRLTEALIVPMILRRVEAVMRKRTAGVSRLWYVSEEDLFPGADAPASLIPNVPFEAPACAPPPASAASDVLFVGSQGHRPNWEGVRHFVATVWPRIRAAVPGVRLRVVGLGPWQDMASAVPAAALDGVDLVGTVEDLAPEYHRARVVVSPVHEGGGSKIKVVEAAAFARPVVASRHSVLGFSPALTKLIVAADADTEMVEGCCRFLENPAEADRVGALMRAEQQAHYARNVAIQRICDDVTSAIGQAITSD